MPLYGIVVLGNVFGFFVCLFFNVLGQITKFDLLFCVCSKGGGGGGGSFWKHLSVSSRGLESQLETRERGTRKQKPWGSDVLCHLLPVCVPGSSSSVRVTSRAVMKTE